MTTRVGGRRFAWLAVGLLAARIALLLFGLNTLPARSAGFGLGNDARRFHDIATAPGTPYRDAQVEVPPWRWGRSSSWMRGPAFSSPGAWRS